MERCPACSARLKDTEHCPRCKANLELVFAAEKLAQFCCVKAIEFWQHQELALAVFALKKSLDLKQTAVGLNFRDFIVAQQCKKAVTLLAGNDLLMAEQTLQIIHCFKTQSQLPKQLQGFIQSLRSS